MSDLREQQRDGAPAPLAGGALRSAISQAMVRIYAEHYGKGATQAKTYEWDGVIVTVLRDVFTTVEHTLIGVGREDTVREVRRVFQATLHDEFTAAVERLTGRRVESFMSQVDTDANIATEIFVLHED